MSADVHGVTELCATDPSNSGKPRQVLVRLDVKGNAEHRREGTVDQLALALILDVASDDDDLHWTNEDHDATARKLVLATHVSQQTSWRIATPVSRWRIWLLTQKELAQQLRTTTRHLQELESRGLPSEGYRDTKLYPWPDVLAWWMTYRLRDNRDFERWLDPRIARARHRLRTVEDLIAAVRVTVA